MVLRRVLYLVIISLLFSKCSRRSLKLRGRHIYTLSDSVLALKGLRDLTIYDTSIDSVSSRICELSKLQRLELRFNRELDQLPASIGQLQELEEFSLAYSRIKELPPSFGALKQLTKLELIDAGFTQLPTVVGELSQLTSLYWAQDFMQHISDSSILWTLSNLEELDIVHSGIESIPNGINELHQLKELRLSANKLIALDGINPDSLAELNTLIVFSNEFSVVPQLVERFKNLTYLGVGYNKIKYIEADLSKLVNLEVLNLAGNPLATLPSNIGALVNLKELYIDNTNISELPASIGNLKNLRKLHVNNTNISELPASIGNLKNLKELSIHATPIQEIPKEFKKLRRLERVWISVEATEVYEQLERYCPWCDSGLLH